MYRLIYVLGGFALLASFLFMLPVFIVCVMIWGLLLMMGLFL